MLLPWKQRYWQVPAPMEVFQKQVTHSMYLYHTANGNKQPTKLVKCTAELNGVVRWGRQAPSHTVRKAGLSEEVRLSWNLEGTEASSSPRRRGQGERSNAGKGPKHDTAAMPEKQEPSVWRSLRDGRDGNRIKRVGPPGYFAPRDSLIFSAMWSPI